MHEVRRSPAPLPPSPGDASQPANSDSAHRLRQGLVWFALWMAVLVVWRAGMLTSPPYWDSILGLWWEASFLADSDFDYRRLWQDEPDTYHGGARVYVLSVLPTLIAVLMRILPTATAAIVGYRLFVFACVSLILVRLQGVVAERWGSVLGVFAAAAVVSTPLFSAQAELLGLEIPLACCVVLAVTSVCRDRLGWATMWGAAAFFVKFTGLLVTASLVGWLGLRVILGRRSLTTAELRRVWTALLANAIWLFVAVRLMDMTQALNKWVAPADRTIYTGLSSIFVWSPDVAVIGGLVMVAALGKFWIAANYDNATPRSGGVLRRWDGAIDVWLNAQRGVVFTLFFVLALFAAVTQVSLIPRYLTVVVPLIYLAGSYCIAPTVSRRRWLIAGLACVVGFNLLNQYGRFLPQQEQWYGRGLGRTGSALERSLEYRVDHQSNIDAIESLASQHHDETVVIGHPFIKPVADPRMGYVERPLRGFTIHPYLDAKGNFKTIDRATLLELPAEPVLVGIFGNSWYLGASLWQVPRPTSFDEVLYDDGLKSPVIAYRKGWSPRFDTPSRREHWYLSHYLPAAPAEERARRLAELYSSQENLDQAVAMARLVVEQEEASIGARLVLAETLFLAGKRSEGLVQWLDSFLAEKPAEPRDATARAAWLAPLELDESFVRGCEALARAEWEPAAEHFHASAARSPDSPWPRYGWAMYCVRIGDDASAIDSLSAALERAPDLLPARRRLGYVYMLQGAYDAARENLRQVVQADPEDAEAWEWLGLTQARSGEYGVAAESFGRVVELRPLSERARRWEQRAVQLAGGDG